MPRTTGQISTENNTKCPWVKGFQLYINEGPSVYQKHDNYSFIGFPLTYMVAFTLYWSLLIIRNSFSRELLDPYSSCFIHYFGTIFVLSRFTAEEHYSKMWQDYENGEFNNEKYPDNKTPSDWFLFRHFKTNLYGKKVFVLIHVLIK